MQYIRRLLHSTLGVRFGSPYTLDVFRPSPAFDGAHRLTRSGAYHVGGDTFEILEGANDASAW